MRTLNRLTIAAAAVALVAVATGCSTGNGRTPAGLPERTATAGAVEITATPTINARDTSIALALNTHMGALDVDPAAVAHLTVAGRDWPAGEWKGDAAGGHHRTGPVTFRAGGPATGTAVFTLGGLDRPVEMRWKLTG